MVYGKRPYDVGHFPVRLNEVMYYLYLPVLMRGLSEDYGDHRLPPNIAHLDNMIVEAQRYAMQVHRRIYDYVYVSARKGWASPDNPLNRPGWHCDGFGTDDLNYVWWRGPGTRFAAQTFLDISEDHVESLTQFEAQIKPQCVYTPTEQHLYEIDPYVVHATPVIEGPGCMREYIKISLSDEKYNLENNSHNYLFDYDWHLHGREEIRNDPHRAQADSAEESA